MVIKFKLSGILKNIDLEKNIVAICRRIFGEGVWLMFGYTDREVNEPFKSVITLSEAVEEAKLSEFRQALFQTFPFAEDFTIEIA